MEERILEVNHISTEFRLKRKTTYAVNDVSFYLNRGEIIGVVGESGSGKSVTQMSVLGLIESPPGHVEGESAVFEGQDLLAPENRRLLRHIRGHKIAMIFQDPMISLNPSITVGEQISETIREHLGLNHAQAKERAITYMKMGKIPDAEMRYDNYPFEFSGGMCQRIMIAMAMSCDPSVLIADEATTALDVTTQAQILEMLQDIVKTTNTSLIIVTHNLGIVARYADRIYVMYGGTIVETATTDDLFRHPSHAYTVGLLNSVPRLDDSKDRLLMPIHGLPPTLHEKPQRCPFYDRCTQRVKACDETLPQLRPVAPGHLSACLNPVLDTSLKLSDAASKKKIDWDKCVLSVRDLRMEFPLYKGGLIKRRIGTVRAVGGVTFDIHSGETLGLVGESGCGKSTVANCLVNLLKPTAGEIYFQGQNIAGMAEHTFRKYRKNIQLVFQDPFSSLDPKQTIGDIVGEPLKIHHLVSSREAYEARVKELFEMIGLNPELMHRSPHELSGGQRQRIGIARALASQPDLIICDEPVSALDVSVQAQIMNLLESLQRKLGVSYLFVAHDLSVVRHISDRIAVMYLGQIVEMSDWKTLYENPKHPYTKTLLSAIPIPDPEVERQRERQKVVGDIPSAAHIPSGCSFHTRCPYATDRCKTQVPDLTCDQDGHMVRCHLYSDGADGKEA